MKVDNTIRYLIIVFIVFLAFVYYKKQLETFKNLIIQSGSSGTLRIKNNLRDIRFNRICIGETCIDGNVLASVLEIFRDKNKKIRSHSTCSDNVCIFPEHLKNFNNSNTEKPDITDMSKLGNEEQISLFNKNTPTNGNSIPDGFRLSLSDSTADILKGFGTDIYKTTEKDIQRSNSPKPFVTRMMSGRICYSPGDKYQVFLQNRNNMSVVTDGEGKNRREFVYYDYDKNKLSDIVYNGKSGINDYEPCYVNYGNADYKYKPKSLYGQINVQTTSPMVNVNLIPIDEYIDIDIANSTNSPHSRSKFFVMGKPYDSTTRIDPPAKNVMISSTVTSSKPTSVYRPSLTSIPLGD